MGNGLWMGFRDHYRDSRYFWHRLYDEKEINEKAGRFILAALSSWSDKIASL
jgi:hypothetical protein